MNNSTNQESSDATPNFAKGSTPAYSVANADHTESLLDTAHKPGSFENQEEEKEPIDTAGGIQRQHSRREELEAYDRK